MPGAILLRNATANAIMPRRLSMQEHLSVDELERNYRITHVPIEWTWYQIIWLKRKRKNNILIVSSVTGYCLEAIHQIARLYNQQGKEGLVNRHHQHPGPKGFWSDERQDQLEIALQEKAPDGGLWNGGKVGDWWTELIGHGNSYNLYNFEAKLSMIESSLRIGIGCSFCFQWWTFWWCFIWYYWPSEISLH